jgi:HEXXH motif-containing protein
MPDLVANVIRSMENSTNALWFPELTADLTACEWTRLSKEFGVTRFTYGTARLLCRDISTPRTIISLIELSKCCGILLEGVEDWGKSYRFNFYSVDEIRETSVRDCIAEALMLIEEVPSLINTIGCLVRSLHVIKPPDEEHDVSFSIPGVPFSIFVSVPESRISSDVLRVAEAIVHEAMHLQLTLIEQVTLLVSDHSKKYYSPWRNEFRDARGILHGLYVFAVIDKFFEKLLTVSDSMNDREFLTTRRGEIQSQIHSLERFRECPDLTWFGFRLVDRLI